jgi:hypothetical protein
MLSTGIRVADDPRALVATAAVQKLDDGLERYWHERRAGRDTDAVARYRQSLEGARKVGVSYMPCKRLGTPMGGCEITERGQLAEAVASLATLERRIEEIAAQSMGQLAPSQQVLGRGIVTLLPDAPVGGAVRWKSARKGLMHCSKRSRRIFDK